MMSRLKTIRKIGDSRGVIFNKEECSIFNLNVGDVITITIDKREDNTTQ